MWTGRERNRGRAEVNGAIVDGQKSGKTETVKLDKVKTCPIYVYYLIVTL